MSTFITRYLYLLFPFFIALLSFSSLSVTSNDAQTDVREPSITIDTRSSAVNLSIEYLNQLLADEKFDEANDLLTATMSTQQNSLKNIDIAMALSAIGDGFYAQKRYAQAIDLFKMSVTYFLTLKNENNKQLAQIYNRIASSYKHLKDIENSAHYFEKALETFTIIGDKSEMARKLNMLAEAERHLGNLLVALEYATRSIRIHEEIDDPEGRAKAYAGAGTIYRFIGRYEKSLEHIIEAQAYYTSINDAGGIAKTSNQMGLLYTRLKQFDQAKWFYQITINLQDRDIQANVLAAALREMAVIYYNESEYNAAKETALKAREIYKRTKEKSNESKTARIIGNIYRAQKMDSQAIKFYQESVALGMEAGSDLDQVKAMLPLASLMKNVNIGNAIELLNQALAITPSLNDKALTASIYKELRDAQKYNKNYVAALQHAEKEISLISTIQKEREEKGLVVAKANLHSYKMELELDTLREKSERDKLELARKTNEIEIAQQARTIADLELAKNKYASYLLVLMVVVFIFVGLLVYVRFAESKRRNEALRELASKDSLTNCYNRRVLFELLDVKFFDEEDFWIILADVDHFKKINDTHGHIKGDEVLREVADALRRSVRENDFVARYGGEEFCIVLPKMSQKQALALAEDMRKEVENLAFDNISVSCSFGVTNKLNAKNAKEVIEQADKALYDAKSNGRNRIILYSGASTLN